MDDLRHSGTRDRTRINLNAKHEVMYWTKKLGVDEEGLRAAIQAAQNAEAGRFDPGHMHEAEEAFRKAKALLDDRENELAKSLFVKSRIAAEKAENAARAMKRKSGEVF